MISFRFHIVSLTAVLLSLGIGLVLGTTFLDEATVNTLRNQLSDLERSLDAAGDRNARQQHQLDSYEQESAALEEQLGERLFTGELADAPVLVVATRGVDEDQVDDVHRALGQADANLLGTWWLSDRWSLDEENEVADLGEALELSIDNADRLRSNLASQLGDVLFAASDAGQGADDLQGLAGTPAQTPDGEPAVVARLREGGFIEYEMAEGADGDVIVLPPSGLRMVFVGGPEVDVPPDQAVLPIMSELASDGPVPVVAVEPSIDQDDDEAVPSLVVDIREDDRLSDRVSTVDDLDRVSGLVATVLALVDADADPGPPVVGHYGLGDGTRVLPPLPEDGQ